MSILAHWTELPRRGADLEASFLELRTGSFVGLPDRGMKVLGRKLLLSTAFLMAERQNKLTDRAKRRVGTVLGDKWVLERLIGVGGMAAVYVGVHRNKKRAAIKILHAELSGDQEIQARFLREGYVANSVEHPGAVRVDDDDITDDGSAYLVMELLEGDSVERRRLRKKGKLPLEEVLWIADHLLEVLAAAHARGVIHRDIKPENLFITFDGRLKVLDFGIARLRDSEREATTTVTGRSMGTPAFMSPEQARGRWNEVDQRSDLWAVGAVMHTLLTGNLVHRGETPNEALAKAMSEAAPPIRELVPDLPSGVAEVIDRALEYQKRRRFTTAQDMLDALRAATHDLEIGTPALTAPHAGGSSTWRALRTTGNTTRAQRRRHWLVAVLLFFVLGATAVVMALRSSARPIPPWPRETPGTPPPEVTVAPVETDALLDISPAATPPSASATPSRSAALRREHPSPAPAKPATSTAEKAESTAPVGGTLSSGCVPPYYLDERGIKHFRPECL